MARKKRVLFLCSENSCRSQMAEGFLCAAAPGGFDVHSAGSSATEVNRRAISMMAEVGIDISRQRSKSVEEYSGQSFDYVITVCGGSKDDSCPVFVGQALKRLHWPFENPARFSGGGEETLEAFRQVRDQIRDKVECFLRREIAGDTLNDNLRR